MKIINEILLSPPSEWGNDQLSNFFVIAQNNRYGTFVQGPKKFQKLIHIDRIFEKVPASISQSPCWMEGMFFFRAHSAYRAGAELAAAGFVVETYPILRTALEYALYAFHIFKKTESSATWLDRANNPVKFKNEFKIGPIKKEYLAASPINGRIADELYNRCIELGGHPNPKGILTNVEFEENEHDIFINNKFLHPGGVPHQLALKTVAQTGINVLKIFEDILTDRFKALSIDKLILLAQNEL